MPHRIAIIGQSNSILQTGFVAHLMQRPEIEIGHMGRIGASPSVILPFFAAPEWLAGHDVCILDIAIMDHVFFWSEAIDLVSISQYVAYAIQMIHAAGCLPLLLIIPHQSALPYAHGGGKIPILHQIYHAVAAQNDAMVLDLTDGLDGLGTHSPALLDAAYSDPNHLSDSVSRGVAARIVSLIDEAMRTPLERRRVSVAFPNFERLGLMGLCPDAPSVMHTTSLLHGHFTFINPGDRLVVPTGPFDRLHAILVNRAQSGAKLAIEGSSTIVKAFGTKNERDTPLVAQLCSVITPVADRDGNLVLSLADPDTPVSEQSCNPLDEHSGHVEISEILIHRGWRSLDFTVPILPPSLAMAPWQP
jgi:hypothetical protein